MYEKFKKLSQKIDYVPIGAFEEADIYFAKLEKKDVFSIGIELSYIPNLEEMKSFIETLNENFGFKTKIQFKYKTKDIKEDLYFNYVKYILDFFLKQNYISSQLTKEQFLIKEDKVNIKFFTQNGYNRFFEIINELKRALKMFGLNTNIYLSIIKNHNLILEDEEKANSLNFKLKENININKKGTKIINKNITSIKDAKDDFVNKEVNIEGMIFDRKDKKTKTGWNVIEFSVTDFDDAIYVTLLAGKTDKELELYDKFKPKQWVSVYGKLELNIYRQNQPEIKSKKLDIIKSKFKQKKDNAKIKRVELNMKTRMSTMDGIASPQDIINKAKEYGHKAVAIADSGSIQSFPAFFNSSKDIKAIYGISINVIDNKNGTVFNCKDSNQNIKDNTYIVFDLETTGLSPICHEIIEFGAIKLKNGVIIDRKQFFIKPKTPISDFTTNLTGITNEMLDNCIDEFVGIKEILDYFQDSVLIAHNAPFDMGFIYQKIDQYNLDEVNFTYIDTVAVAKILEPTAKRFNLEKVATRMGHKYDPSIAHRADYDAEVLTNVWLTMISKLRRSGVETLKQLEEKINDKIYESHFEKEITLLAKNNKGLKELFKIVSKASTEQYFKGPKIFWDQLSKSGNLLIGSGGIKSKLVDLMLTGTKKQIIKNISKYDYIELQPLKNFSHLISRGNIKKTELIEVIKFVIKEAKKQSKIIVATSDGRYLDEKDKLFHSVYINAKGLGGLRHYLFKYNETKPDYPVQHYMSTDEMLKEFEFLENKKLIEEIVITNSNLIADSIEKCIVIKDKLYTPKIPNSDEKLSEMVWKNAREKYGDKLPDIVKERIDKELSSIIKYGFSVIYYIAHKLVKKSLDDGYLVGSRGSVGSSIVATLSGITEVNPLPPHYVCKNCKKFEFYINGEYDCGYDLLDKNCSFCNKPYDKDGHNIPFETFLGFDANKVPDIDLNFSGDYQSIIHKEVKKEFGEYHSFRAGTISTVAEKTAFGFVKAWAEETNKSISKPFIEFIAKKVAGTKRTTGQHPGGIIVIPSEFDVEDFTPINFPANDKSADWLTTHFDFHAIHDNVLKLDLLGHDDPTAIRMLQKITGVNPKEIPYTDEKVISLFSSTKELNINPEDIFGEITGVMGIPEFGTKFVRGMLKTVKVKKFSDLVSISGLSHGTDVWTNNGEELVKKQGKGINDLISCRDDIMSDLINKGIDPLEAFTIMEQVRKGKSINKEQEQNMIKHNIEDWYINSCKIIKYMFPKAHATAYVQMAWKIAWFKIYYPLEYYATYFTTRADVFDIETFYSGAEEIKKKIIDFKSRRYKRGDDALSNKEVALIPIFEISLELYARGFNIGNISISESLANEWKISSDKKTLIPPFSCIDGLGESVAESIIKARKERPFISIEDLKLRTSLNKTSLKTLEDLGAFKDMEKTNQLSLF
ncbi:MAG: PolC-type DNA polymerase III [Mycoplasma sp.]|nr:PolC-type DNA polymerase III [Mycoplasma sp.]